MADTTAILGDDDLLGELLAKDALLSLEIPEPEPRLNEWMFPIVNLPAVDLRELVQVQPMAGPAGRVLYLDFERLNRDDAVRFP